MLIPSRALFVVGKASTKTSRLMLVKGICAALKGNVGKRRMLDVGKSSGRSVQWAGAFDGAMAGDLLALWRTFRWPFTLRPDNGGIWRRAADP